MSGQNNCANKRCKGCGPVRKFSFLRRLENEPEAVIALAGNPNTGKSTLFNALTGLRQHTGNWPGKTVTRAEGLFAYNSKVYKLIDLPGTYSLLSMSTDEEIARNFLLFEQPELVLVVIDATRLESNLNLAFQIFEITERVIICLNLIDEAERRGLQIDVAGLERELGVPVVPMAARSGKGIRELLEKIELFFKGELRCNPQKLGVLPDELEKLIAKVSDKLKRLFP